MAQKGSSSVARTALVVAATAGITTYVVTHRDEVKQFLGKACDTAKVFTVKLYKDAMSKLPSMGQDKEDEEGEDDGDEEGDSNKESDSENQEMQSCHDCAFVLMGKKAKKGDKKRLVKLELESRTPVTHDSFIFKFRISPGDDEELQANAENLTLGLPVGNHVKFLADIVGKTDLRRSYTPISPSCQKNTVDFLIKIYPDGLMTNYLKSMPIGGHMSISGPFGLIEYLGNSEFEVCRQIKTFKEVLFIAGGTGLTPIFSVISAVLKTDDPLKMYLLFANKTVDDIMLHETLLELSKEHEDRFKYYNTLDVAPADRTWSEGIGHVTGEMIEEFFPLEKDSETQAAMVCGPPAMVRQLETTFEKLSFPNMYNF